MKRKKVDVNLLNQGTVSTGLELTLYRWMQQKKEYEFYFSEPTDRPIANNRNKIVKKFLGSDKDVLCMIDDDNPPKPERNIFDLIDFDKDVIGAVYPGRGDNGLRFHVYKFTNNYPDKIEFTQYPPSQREGLQQVDGIGTGCIFIQRHVLEAIKRPFEDLFDEDGILVTNDDLHFSHKCNQKGFEIWTHWDYICSHYKTVDLLKMTDLIVRAASDGKPMISRNDL